MAPPTSASSSMHDDVWRSAMLFQKEKSRLFGRGKWKPRYAVLTSTSVMFFKSPSHCVRKGRIDLTQCHPEDIQEMPRDCLKTGNSASSIWRLAIQTPTRRYFLAHSTPDDMHAWFNDLQHIVKQNAVFEHSH